MQFVAPPMILQKPIRQYRRLRSWEWKVHMENYRSRERKCHETSNLVLCRDCSTKIDNRDGLSDV